MSQARSTDSVRRTVEQSDLEATQQLLVEQTLLASRQDFRENKNQSTMEAAIRASLKQLEQDDARKLDKAMLRSLGVEIQTDIVLPTAAVHTIEDDDLQRALAASMKETETDGMPNAVTRVVAMGHILEEVVEVYTIFADKSEQLGEDRLVELISEMLKQRQQQALWGFH